MARKRLGQLGRINAGVALDGKRGRRRLLHGKRMISKMTKGKARVRVHATHRGETHASMKG